MKLSEKFKELTEAKVIEADSIFQKIADTVKGKALVDMRKPLEAIFPKKDIDFTFSPVPHFRIKYKGKTLIIVNKKYADKAALEFDKYAIGFDGDI